MTLSFSFFTLCLCLFLYFCVMKLSILIPVFNYDCRKLVRQLLAQLPAESEIIVADDCSTDVGLDAVFCEMAKWDGCHVWRAPENLGRSAIRNKLAGLSHGEWLLFMDCDAEIEKPDFLSEYMSHTEEEYDVICGGTGNSRQCPRPDAALRYRYEIQGEEYLTLERRRKEPYARFRTFNFMIRSKVFFSIRFDESCRGYGHEDTLFGMELQYRGTPLLHIDNKAINGDLEPSEVFLAKTEEALRSLHRMHAEGKEVYSPLMQLCHKGGRLFVCLMSLWHSFFGRLERRNLVGLHPSLFVFQLYKLGYLCTLIYESRLFSLLSRG